MSKFIDRTGEQGVANNGMRMIIIACRGTDDIDIQFEDGTIVYNKQYCNFKKGKIKYPNTLKNSKTDCSTNVKKSKSVVKKKLVSRGECGSKIGEVVRANNGMLMEVVGYRNAKDIDVKFEDDVIVYNKRYDKFIVGNIGHPNKKGNDVKEDRIGKKFNLSNGDVAEIIDYNGAFDVTVKLSSGLILSNISYQSLVKGCNITLRSKGIISKYLNSVIMMSNGLRARILNYRTSKDIDVEFEDGVVVKNRYLKCFKEGATKHPLISNHYCSKEFYGFTGLEKAFEAKGKVFYYCTDRYGVQQVLTLQQMMNKSGIEPIF